MAIYHLDTSVLVKRYIDAPGSTWTRHLYEARNSESQVANVFIMGDIVMVEVAAALAILERRKIILQGTAVRA